LRLGAVATLPWATAGGLAITAQRRAKLEQTLPFSELAGAVMTLDRRRGADRERLPRTGVRTQCARCPQLFGVITAPDGRVALSAEVMMACPTP